MKVNRAAQVIRCRRPPCDAKLPRLRMEKLENLAGALGADPRNLAEIGHRGALDRASLFRLTGNLAGQRHRVERFPPLHLGGSLGRGEQTLQQRLAAATETHDHATHIDRLVADAGVAEVGVDVLGREGHARGASARHVGVDGREDRLHPRPVLRAALDGLRAGPLDGAKALIAEVLGRQDAGDPGIHRGRFEQHRAD